MKNIKIKFGRVWEIRWGNYVHFSCSVYHLWWGRVENLSFKWLDRLKFNSQCDTKYKVRWPLLKLTFIWLWDSLFHFPLSTTNSAFILFCLLKLHFKRYPDWLTTLAGTGKKPKGAQMKINDKLVIQLICPRNYLIYLTLEIQFSTRYFLFLCR